MVWKTRIIVSAVFLLLVLGTLPLVALTESPSPEPPHGLVVVLENKPQESQLDLRALKNPYIRGVALQIRWRDIEPVHGQLDWSRLDHFGASECSAQF